ncbi:MAG: hypothetical protein WBC02_07765 [Candidatus Aminicenantaceae bacterium]
MRTKAEEVRTKDVRIRFGSPPEDINPNDPILRNLSPNTDPDT